MVKPSCLGVLVVSTAVAAGRSARVAALTDVDRDATTCRPAVSLLPFKPHNRRREANNCPEQRFALVCLVTHTCTAHSRACPGLERLHGSAERP